jgi:hypothetical protein
MYMINGISTFKMDKTEQRLNEFVGNLSERRGVLTFLLIYIFDRYT